MPVDTRQKVLPSIWQQHKKLWRHIQSRRNLKGEVIFVVRALYGLKSSGASWRQMLAHSLIDIGYVSSKADPDVWLKSKTKPDGKRYQE